MHFSSVFGSVWCDDGLDVPVMRSSAPEGPHAPRAKQAPPSSSSGANLLGPAGAQPPTHHVRNPAAATAYKNSSQRAVTSAPLPRSTATAAPSRSTSAQPRQQISGTSPPTSQRSSSKSPSPGNNKTATSPNNKTRPSSSHKSSSLLKSPLPKQDSSPPKSAPSNFGEYDDQEWDVGVGHLIIDLDADIAQADKGRMSGSMPIQGPNASQGTLEDKHSLKMKIKRTKPSTKTSEAKHEIVKSDVMSSPGGAGIPGSATVPNADSASPAQQNGTSPKTECGSSPRTPTSNQRTIFKEKKRRLESMNGSTPQPPVNQLLGPRLPVVSSTTVPVMTSGCSHNSVQIPPFNSMVVSSPTIPPASTLTQSMPSHIVNATIKTESPKGSNIAPNSSMIPVVSEGCHKIQNQAAAINSSTTQTPQVQTDLPSNGSKILKLGAECAGKRDACVGTSVGTITEPDCLGPCEPGSSVTLEGIVWHETESGVLVVNVTWRGKTYVGTLLDCTKHDWAPPRFCDSPTSDLESRTPKGRAKRGRAAASSSNSTPAPSTPELSVTETRSGKIRGGVIKGRRGTPTLQPPASPVKIEAGNGCNKRKGREVDANSSDSKVAKRSRSSSRGTPTNSCSSPTLEQESATIIDPPQQPPLSPQLIECPEPNCNKKYKHINGLKYHQSHAHMDVSSANDEELRDSKTPDETDDNRLPSPKPVIATPADASNKNLLKPSVLRPTPLSLSPVPLNVDNQTLKPPHLYLFSNNVTASTPLNVTVPTSLIVTASTSVNVTAPISVNVTGPTSINVTAPSMSLTETAPAGFNVTASMSLPKLSTDAAPNNGPNRIVNSVPSPNHQMIGQNSENSSESPLLNSQQLNSSPLVIPGMAFQYQGSLPFIGSSMHSFPTIPQPSSYHYHLPSQGDRDLRTAGPFVCKPTPQVAPLSSLPGLSPTKAKVEETDHSSMPEAKGSLVNGVTISKEDDEDHLREDAHSPAYSDISDANDTAPLLDSESDSKDTKDEKKPDLAMGPNSPYAYGLYYGGPYGPPQPYMMPPIQSPAIPLPVSVAMKPGDMKENTLDKNKKEPPITNQFPPQYMYSYSHLYPPGYSDPYARDPIYKDLMDRKLESKEELTIEDSDKCPTDLSRSCSNFHSGSEKISPQKESANTSCYRYLDYLDSKQSGGQGSAALDKQSSDSKKSSPLISPRLASSPVTSKEDKRPPEAKLSEGVKPTMETTGPPPPPTNAYYPPFPPYPHSSPFDPYQGHLMPLPGGFSPSYLQGPHAPPGLGALRYPMGVGGIAEDLSRSSMGILPPPALYGSRKMVELQERAQKSPSSAASSCGLMRGSSPLPKDHPMSSIPGCDRKTPPSRLSSLSYPIMPPTAQFPPHFAALGVNPTLPSMTGPTAPSSGMLLK